MTPIEVDKPIESKTNKQLHSTNGTETENLLGTHLSLQRPARDHYLFIICYVFTLHFLI